MKHVHECFPRLDDNCAYEEGLCSNLTGPVLETVVNQLHQLIFVLFRLECCQVLELEQAIKSDRSDVWIRIITRLFDDSEQDWVYLIHAHLCQCLEGICPT